MLNLNYNINKALGGGGCIGVMKYNYSASIVVAGAGGGGATGGDLGAGGGGGGGMSVSQSISIIPNLTYQINVGGGGAVNSDGQDSYLTGWDDNDTIPIAFYAQGGRKGTTGVGGNSGTGSVIRNGSAVSYPAFTGGTLYTGPGTFGPQYGAGGGASNSANGTNGADAQGGTGAAGVTAGGGGGANFVGPTGPYGQAGYVGSGLYGMGGDGYSTIQNQLVNPRVATVGSSGAVVISYTGKTKAFVTGNVTTTYLDGTTTHTFSSGSGTFQYVVPYPWEEPISPYQVVLCPPTYQ